MITNSNNNNIIIGFAGLSGAGKTTLEEMFQATHDTISIRFADPLKAVCSDLFSWPLQTLNDRDARCHVDKWWADKLGITDFTPRRAMQIIGTDIVRSYRPDFWVNCVEKKILKAEEDHKYKIIIVPDCRFPNEVNLVRKYGYVIHIHRPGMELTETHSHASETALNNFCAYDYTFANSGSKEELASCLARGDYSIFKRNQAVEEFNTLKNRNFK